MTVARLVSWLALLVSLSSTVVFAVIYIGSNHVAIIGQEQNVVFGIETLLNGRLLYRDPTHLPFAVTQYTPLYYEICFQVCRWLGLHANDLQAIYLVGRLTSAVATIACCCILAACMWHYGQRDAVTCIALAFSLPVLIGPWAWVARPDPLYLMLVFASLLAALRYADTLGIGPLVISCALLVAGFYTKQTAFFLFPLPIVVRMARQGWRGARLRDVLICLLVYAAGSTFLTPLMRDNFAIGLANGIDLSRAWHKVYLPMVYRVPLLLAACLAFRARMARHDWMPRAISVACLWYLLVGAVLAMKWGSLVNYLDEFIIGCLLLVGTAPALSTGFQNSRQGVVATLLLGLVIATQLTSVYDYRGSRWSAMVDRGSLYEAGHALATDDVLQGQPVLTLDTTSSLFIPDRAVFVPLDVLGTAAAAGHFDLGLVTREVQNAAILNSAIAGFCVGSAPFLMG